MPDFDLFTFGSPCQDFSVAGKQKGSTWTCKDCGHEYNPLDIHYSKRNICPECDSKNIEKTRSSLVVEALRIIKYKKPKYLLMENVKNLVGKKFKPSFNKIITELNEYGYNTYYKVLNAKDYGIPQNRERIFVICIRKDIDNKNFEFPEGFDNGIRLKDLLEDNVDEKYYISQEKTNKLIEQLKDKDSLLLDMCQAKREGKPREYTEFAPTISARDYKEPRLINEKITGVYNQNDGFTEKEYGCTLDASYYKGLGNNQNRNAVLESNNITVVGQISNDGSQAGKVYDTEGVFPTVCACTHGYAIGNILESNELQFIGGIGEKDRVGDNKQCSRNYPQGNRVYDSEGIAVSQTAQGGGIGSYTGLYKVKGNINQSPMPELVGGLGEINFGKQYRQGNRVYSSEKIAMCLMSQPVGNAGGYSYLYNVGYKIRKLTPKECWRLMGFDDEDIDKCINIGISNTQLYKQAGNSIVTNVLYYIFKNLFNIQEIK